MLAPRLAGTGRVRLSRDGGRSYPQRFERNLSTSLPLVPAAVRIYGADGCCSAIFLDFDTAVDGLDRVLADVRMVTTWLYRHGVRWIEDHSPGGGRHIYIPLAERMPFEQARTLVEALASRHRSLDATPHQNLRHGCMRVAGSVHKRGGHQELDMSLTMAGSILDQPNTAAAITALTFSLRPEMDAVRIRRAQQAAPLVDEDSGFQGGLSARVLETAVHGTWDTSRYASPSEARQSVLAAAAGAGMELTDVQRRMQQGTWPGLAQFYTRYRPHSRAKALFRDWRNATSFVAKQRSAGEEKSVRKSPTSLPDTQGGSSTAPLRGSHDEHRFIRTWRNALLIREQGLKGSRKGLAQRMILRALGAAAHMTGSRFVEFGVRSLALASGVDHTTVAAHLRDLRASPESLVQLVSRGRGTHGDLYTLTVPQALQEASEQVSWRRGRLEAMRPVFRVLGMPAAFIYETLEHSPGPMGTSELASISGLGRSAASEALEILSAYGLSRRTSSGWEQVPGVCLESLAEQLGVTEELVRLRARYKAERALWRLWLARAGSYDQFLPSPGEDYPWELFVPPDVAEAEKRDIPSPVG